MNKKPTLQLESQMGPMPYLKKIFQYSDAETQKNLKLVNKAFWKEHALSKYRNNFSPAQEPRHNQLYCHGPCPNVDHFEDCYEPKLFTTDRGEICAQDEPRTRQGWLINNLDEVTNPFEKKPKPKKIGEWSPCRECWKKFVAKNPEYDCIN